MAESEYARLPAEWAERLFTIDNAELRNLLREFGYIFNSNAVPSDSAPNITWRALHFWEAEPSKPPERVEQAFFDQGTAITDESLLPRLIDHYRDQARELVALTAVHKYPGVSLILERVTSAKSQASADLAKSKYLDDANSPLSHRLLFLPVDCNWDRFSIPSAFPSKELDYTKGGIGSLLRDARDRIHSELTLSGATVADMVKLASGGHDFVTPQISAGTHHWRTKLSLASTLSMGSDRDRAADLLSRICTYAYWLDIACSIAKQNGEDISWEAIQYTPYAPRDISHANLLEVGFYLNTAYQTKPDLMQLRLELSQFESSIGSAYATYAVAKLEAFRQRINLLLRFQAQSAIAHEVKTEINRVRMAVTKDDKPAALSLTDDLYMACEALFALDGGPMRLPFPAAAHLALTCAVSNCIIGARVSGDLAIVATFAEASGVPSELPERKRTAEIIEFATNRFCRSFDPPMPKDNVITMGDMDDEYCEASRVLAVMFRNLLIDAWRRCGDIWSEDGETRAVSPNPHLEIKFNYSDSERFRLEIISSSSITQRIVDRSFKWMHDHPTGYVTVNSRFWDDLTEEQLYNRSATWFRGSQLAQRIAEKFGLVISLGCLSGQSRLVCESPGDEHGPNPSLG